MLDLAGKIKRNIAEKCQVVRVSSDEPHLGYLGIVFGRFDLVPIG